MPVTSANINAPTPAPTASQEAHAVAEQSGFCRSHRAFPSENTVQLAIAVTASATPAPQGASALESSGLGVMPLAGGNITITDKPATVNASPGASDRQRRPWGLPSTISASGMVPMISVGRTGPISRMDATSNA